MKVRLTVLTLIVALVGAFVIPPVNSLAQDDQGQNRDRGERRRGRGRNRNRDEDEDRGERHRGGLTKEVSGTFSKPDGSQGDLTGTLHIVRFAVEGGKIVAKARLTDLKDGSGNPLGRSKSAHAQGGLITLPVNIAQHTCDILNLNLGPLDLNLLGLKIHLNEVVLNITAQQGAGNLLGNLLCDVAHLLDGNGALGAIVGKLNQILRAL